MRKTQPLQRNRLHRPPQTRRHLERIQTRRPTNPINRPQTAEFETTEFGAELCGDAMVPPTRYRQWRRATCPPKDPDGCADDSNRFGPAGFTVRTAVRPAGSPPTPTAWLRSGAGRLSLARSGFPGIEWGPDRVVICPDGLRGWLGRNLPQSSEGRCNTRNTDLASDSNRAVRVT